MIEEELRWRGVVWVRKDTNSVLLHQDAVIHLHLQTYLNSSDAPTYM